MRLHDKLTLKPYSNSCPLGVLSNSAIVNRHILHFELDTPPCNARTKCNVFAIDVLNVTYLQRSLLASVGLCSEGEKDDVCRVAGAPVFNGVLEDVLWRTMSSWQCEDREGVASGPVFSVHRDARDATVCFD
jgi:hypothetical protein